MPNRVNAPVHAVKPAVLRSARNRKPIETERAQLFGRNDAVLPGSELRDPLANFKWATFVAPSATRMAHLPSLAARA
jgi:hypothetical protein